MLLQFKLHSLLLYSTRAVFAKDVLSFVFDFCRCGKSFTKEPTVYILVSVRIILVIGNLLGDIVLDRYLYIIC